MVSRGRHSCAGEPGQQDTHQQHRRMDSNAEHSQLLAYQQCSSVAIRKSSTQYSCIRDSAYTCFVCQWCLSRVCFWHCRQMCGRCYLTARSLEMSSSCHYKDDELVINIVSNCRCPCSWVIWWTEAPAAWKLCATCTACRQVQLPLPVDLAEAIARECAAAIQCSSLYCQLWSAPVL